MGNDFFKWLAALGIFAVILVVLAWVALPVAGVLFGILWWVAGVIAWCVKIVLFLGLVVGAVLLIIYGLARLVEIFV